VLTFRSLLQYLPKLALSIMIIFAVAKLIDVPTMIRYYKVSPWDCATMLVTLCMTLVLGVANGMLASIGFSVLVFINYAHQPTISRLGRYFGSTEYAPNESSHTTGRGSGRGRGGGGDDDDDGGDGGGGRVITISKVLVLRFEAPLFFANCRALSRRLMVELEQRGLRKEGRRWIGCVLDLGSVGWVDVTAADVLKHPVKMFGKHGLPIYLARANRKTATMLRATGLTRELERFGGGATVSVHDAVKDLLTFSRAAEKAKRRDAKAERLSRESVKEDT
jgi:MFS superfamily sulfate permease-like transporter